MSFKDHFSSQAKDYAKYRPNYPQELFEYIISHTPNKDQCWDCGTGNGQAALALSPHFKRIIATDPSASQIENAYQADNIKYAVASAEKTNIQSSSIDLISVAQAYHWFNHELFTKEAKRVAKPNALIAVWGYELAHVNSEVDKVFMRYYKDILGEYWPKERVHVERRYSDLPFPFEKVILKEFQLTKHWSLDDYLNYLSTWSAFQKYQSDKRQNPLSLVQTDFIKAWKKPKEVKAVIFPVFLKLGTIK